MGHSIFPVAAEFTRDYYGLDLTPEEIMEEWLSMAGNAYAHVPMKEGARDYLSRCARGGERMAVVTACVPALCRTALERHGLTDCFEEIVFAQELGLEKRDPQVYRIATERLRVSPGDCTLYEDAPSNCAAAGWRYDCGGGIRRLLRFLPGGDAKKQRPLYPQLHRAALMGPFLYRRTACGRSAGLLTPWTYAAGPT